MCKIILKSAWADQEGWMGGGGQRVRTPLETVFLKILVRTSLEKQLGPMGPIASRGRSERPSVKYNYG